MAPEAGLEAATRCLSRPAPSARDPRKGRIPQTISALRGAGNSKNGPRNRQQTVNPKTSDEGRPGELIPAAIPAGRRLRSRGPRTPNVVIRSQSPGPPGRTARNLEADETEGKGRKAGERPPKRGDIRGDKSDDVAQFEPYLFDAKANPRDRTRSFCNVEQVAVLALSPYAIQAFRAPGSHWRLWCVAGPIGARRALTRPPVGNAWIACDSAATRMRPGCGPAF
jgi:hypothetical protein